MAIKVLGGMRQDDPDIDQVRKDLIQIVEASDEVELLVAARESLAQIGDPRFTGSEPIMVRIPPQMHGLPLSPREWKELKSSTLWPKAKTIRRLALTARVVDYGIFTKLNRRRKPQSYEFEIGKYPVTNLEYSQFSN